MDEEQRQQTPRHGILEYPEAVFPALGRWVAPIAGYGEYLGQFSGEYRQKVFDYIDQDDSPRPVTYQLDLLRRVGFAHVELPQKKIVASQHSVPGRNSPLADRINVLFVCSKNRWRSPSAEAIYRDDGRVLVRSRGTARSAVQRVHAADLHWADLVLVMEGKHRSRLRADHPGETRFLPIHVLDILDDYQFMEDELVESIRSAAEPIIEDFHLKQPPEG